MHKIIFNSFTNTMVDIYSHFFNFTSAVIRMRDTKCSTVSPSRWTTSPTNWSNTSIIISTWFVAQSSIILFISFATERLSYSSRFRFNSFPANWADASVSCWARSVAKGSWFFPAISACSDYFSNSPSIRIFPTSTFCSAS